MSEAPKTFDQMLAELHDGSGAKIDSSSLLIKIDNNTRSFVYPETFNNIIGYEGDVHSQRITFAIPSSYCGHELFACENKKIRWKNNEVEGISDLERVSLPDGEEDNNYYGYDWIIPPEVYTKAGTIAIAISFYDLDVAGKIGFSWNTPVDKTLRVGESDRNVGLIPQNNQLLPAYVPSLNEILTIDVENRRIVAPAGYNYTFANYGDIGTSCVYFRAPRYIRGMDLLNADTLVSIAVSYSGDGGPFNITHDFITNDFAEGSHGDGTVLIKWMVDSSVTSNGLKYVGQITIGITIKNTDKALIWKTSPFKGLTIGQALEGSSELQDIHYGYVIDANETLNQVQAKTIPGVVVLRKVDDETDQSILREGETVIRYDEGRNGSLGRYTEEDGLQDLVRASDFPIANTIVKYDENAKLHSELAVGDDDVVTVEYLETNEYLVLGDTSSRPHPFLVATFNSNGNLESGEPTKDSEVATKQYVDSTTGTIQNLLYNPYFDVNQYGFSSIANTEIKYMASFFIADRWKVYGRPSGGSSLSWTPTKISRNDKNQIVIDNSTNESRVILLQTFDQEMLKHYLDKELILGCKVKINNEEIEKSYTLTIEKSKLEELDKKGEHEWGNSNTGGVIYEYSYKNSAGKTEKGVIRLRAYTGATPSGQKATVSFQLYIPQKAPEITVLWMSLAEGSIMVVPQRPDPLLELKRCQQFYQTIPSMWLSPQWVGTGYADFIIPLQSNLRKTPDVVIYPSSSNGNSPIDPNNRIVFKGENGTDGELSAASSSAANLLKNFSQSYFKWCPWYSSSRFTTMTKVTFHDFSLESLEKQPSIIHMRISGFSVSDNAYSNATTKDTTVTIKNTPTAISITRGIITFTTEP